MTIARRLEALEASMSPSQRIAAWLDEAHGYKTLEEYVRWLLDQPPGAFPVNRLLRDAVAAARAATRGEPGDQVARAVRQQSRETLLRYEFAIGLNLTAHEQVEREGLVWGMLVGQLGIVLLRQQYEPESVPLCLEELIKLRGLFARQVDELLAGQAARVEIEAGYFDGHEALFPALATAWTERLGEYQKTTIMADRLAELDGAPRSMLHDPLRVATRTAEVVRDHIARAKVTALEKLDEERKALAIADRWLRDTLER